MTVFSYGDFVFQTIDARTCRIGNVSDKKTLHANGAVLGSSYKGPALIPEIAYDDKTKRKYKVIEISIYCFRGCTNLKEAVLPQTLEIINCDSFWGTNIVNLVIPKSVTTINNYSFSSMYSLTSIIFEVGSKLKNVGTYFILTTNSLTRIVLPPSLRKIEGVLFTSSNASPFEFVYCGANVLENANLTSPSNIKAYVTERYPKDALIGGITPSLINDNSCFPYFEYQRMNQCTKGNHHCNSNNLMLVCVCLLMIAS